MARSSLFILIAAIAIASFFVETAAGQMTITIPKIKIPKVPKTDPSPTPNDQDPVTTDSNSTSNSSSSQAGGDVRGKPIPGAKITFSNNPDGSSPKTSFTSRKTSMGGSIWGARRCTTRLDGKP